jgi:hypothetical protein
VELFRENTAFRKESADQSQRFENFIVSAGPMTAITIIFKNCTIGSLFRSLFGLSTSKVYCARLSIAQPPADP